MGGKKQRRKEALETMAEEPLSIPVLEEILDGSPNTNIVEIYICPKKAPGALAPWLNVRWPKEPEFLAKFPPGNHQETQEFHYKDLCYTYDLNNDSQRVTRRIVQKDVLNGSFYTISFQEDVVPVHRFPCVTDMSIIKKVSRVNYRINNRLSLVHDQTEGTTYFTYHHSPQMDLHKAQFDLQKMLFKVLGAS